MKILFRLANFLHLVGNADIVWNIVKETRKLLVHDYTKGSCQMNQYTTRNLISADEIKKNIRIIGIKLRINETISLKREPSNVILDLAVEMFTYLTACPDTKLIHLYHHLFNQNSTSVKDIILALNNALRMKPKSYLKKVWVKFTQVLKLQNVNIDQLINGLDLSTEDKIILGNSTLPLHSHLDENLSKLNKAKNSSLAFNFFRL